MESAGVTWRPVYAVLEGHFDLTVGNARHIRNAPGRKTEVISRMSCRLSFGAYCNSC
jgi:transposase